MERPTVGVALTYDPQAGESRLVIGAVGEVPMAWTFASLEEIDSSAVAEQIDPTPDLAGSERYKRHITSVFVDRAIAVLTKAGK
jgi:carbon-monoxide dehydrogenase medium subunit